MFACGRYEGIDYRVVEDARERMTVDEVSLGDYVLSGGEVAVLVMAEAISRLLPGVVGNVRSVEEDSFSDGHPRRPGLHPSARCGAAAVPAGAAVRPPWRDRPLAA